MIMVEKLKRSRLNIGILTRLKNFFKKGVKMVDMKRVGEVVGAVALGIIGGLVAASIVNYLTRQYECPSCRQQITQGVRKCPHCKTYLEWD